MNAMLKRIVCVGLSALLLLGCFAGCGNAESPALTTQPTETTAPAAASGLKILTLGHSLTLDSCHMLALIAQKEGYSDLTVGTLYSSGCPLSRHVDNTTKDLKGYALHLSSTETANQPPEIFNDVSAKDALRMKDWDLVILQGGVFEIAHSATYITGSIQTLQQYVKENSLNPNVKFAWHMPWAPPVDPDLMNSFGATPNSYAVNYAAYNNDRQKFYQDIASCVQAHILSDDTFIHMIPTGTAMENALSSYLTEKDLHRDYVHATDLGRVIAAYTWYCVLAGVEQLEELKLDAVPKIFLRTTVSVGDWVLTDEEKAIVLESVNNTLKNPLAMTQSQYTQAPAA